MFVLKNEGRRGNFFRYMGARDQARPCHYRHGPCQATGVVALVRHGQARSCHCRHGPCQLSGVFRLNFFFSFS